MEQGFHPDYKEQAGSLADTQENLGEALALVQRPPGAGTGSAVRLRSATAMHEAQELLAKPQTDAVTDGTEARSVDALSDLINLINEQAQRAATAAATARNKPATPAPRKWLF